MLLISQRLPALCCQLPEPLCLLMLGWSVQFMQKEFPKQLLEIETARAAVGRFGITGKQQVSAQPGREDEKGVGMGRRDPA